MTKQPESRSFISDCIWLPEHLRQRALDLIRGFIEQAVPHRAAFYGDNLLTFGKNLSFLSDQRFMAAAAKHITTTAEQTILWRTYILCWAGQTALRRRGDFVECGCYRGTSARIMCDYLDLTGKTFWLYDLFEHEPGMPHPAQNDHGPELFGFVKSRFPEANVRVIQGNIPAALKDAPDEIAFLHVDLNNADAELGTYETLFDRVTEGGVIVLDDYGWIAYQRQKRAADDFFSERGYMVCELPTGQGLLIK